MNSVTDFRPIDRTLAFSAAKPCLCGRGWCEEHGTFHLSDATERSAWEAAELGLGPSTRGGRRVSVKRPGGDNY